MTARGARSSGVTLVETVVAMGVLAMLLLGLGATTLGSVQVNELVLERRLALNQAQSVLNRLLADTQLQATFSDPTTGDPTKLTYDLAADLGESAPAGLGGWSGTAELRSYRFDQLVGEVPQAWRDYAEPRPFVWNEGQLFEVTVAVTWIPASYTRSQQAGSLTVSVSSLYYPPPPWDQ